MTHSELRDYIDKFDAAGMVDEPAVKALRAVVELHEPYGDVQCSLCENGQWPCSTIRTISEALI